MNMHRVHCAALIGAAGLCFASTAYSADLPVKSPAYKAPVAPIYSWTGFYAGLNAGGVWANTNITYTSSAFGFSGPAGAAFLDSNTSGHQNASGFTGGGQIGYNYQTGVVVWGIEADIGYTGLKNTRIIAVNLAPLGFPAFTDTFSQTMESNWLATVRGRLGYATGPYLFYATGGLAIAEVKYSDSAFFPASNSVNAASSSQTRTGWTVGGGAEWMFAPNWSVKAEYLYVDLGSTTYTSVNSVLNTPPNLATITYGRKLTENIARLGVNYRFGP